MSEIASNSYAHFAIPRPEQPLVHVHPDPLELGRVYQPVLAINATPGAFLDAVAETRATRSEEHTSELQSLMRISYAVFCLKKKINNHNKTILRITQHN